MEKTLIENGLMQLTAKYNHGDIVYIIVDPDQLEKIITSYTVYPNDVLYNVSHGDHESTHYDFELSNDRDINKALDIKKDL